MILARSISAKAVSWPYLQVTDRFFWGGVFARAGMARRYNRRVVESV